MDAADIAQVTLDRQDASINSILSGETEKPSTLPFFTMGIPKSKKAEPIPEGLDHGDLPVDPDAPYGRKADGTPYKRRPNGAVGKQVGRPAGQSKLAAEAAAVLVAANELVATALMVGRLPQTASQLIEAQERFQAQASAALENDPALARAILRSGAKGGKLALAAAYAIMFAGVGMTGYMEYTSREPSA